MSTAIVRPIRFGFTGGASSKQERLDSARAVEALGYSTFGLADHFVRPFAPLRGTSSRGRDDVVAHHPNGVGAGFREPAVLAKELATLDVLSDGPAPEA
jgi:alkanesulfonate monooxygenase SsuD/methylene tetrahydromethanopterin reductase-like flavin-dependent oxidoreductase (luciferase family)